MYDWIFLILLPCLRCYISCEVTNGGKDVEKRKPLHTVGRNSAATVEYSMEFSQKTKNRTTYDPVIPLLGIYVKKKKTH